MYALFTKTMVVTSYWISILVTLGLGQKQRCDAFAANHRVDTLERNKRYVNLPIKSMQKPKASLTALEMKWLQDWFGGGAYNLRIDYNTLDFPGTELAQISQYQEKTPSRSPSKPGLHIATFAGGCFWGMELAFQRIPGIVYTVVGYGQGEESSPTYDQVCAGNTGHTEAVCVYYQQGEDGDSESCSYETLVDAFLDRIDPTTVNGQGRDFGKQYRTGIYFHSKEQEAVARERLDLLQRGSKKRIATECEVARNFWPAEKYHQQYLQKGGRFGNNPQSAEKGNTDEIQCYG